MKNISRRAHNVYSRFLCVVPGCNCHHVIAVVGAPSGDVRPFWNEFAREVQKALQNTVLMIDANANTTKRQESDVGGKECAVEKPIELATAQSSGSRH